MAFNLKSKRSRPLKQNTAKRMLIKQIVVGVVLTILVGGILTLIWHGTRLEGLQITQIDVEGGETISTERVRKIVETELSDTYYRLIPKRFAYLFPKQAIVKQVSQIPRIKNVAVDRTDASSILVTFDEYIPFALWCDQLDSEQCVFVDSTGYGFAMAPQLEGGALVRYISEVPAEVGATLFDSSIDNTKQFISGADDGLGIQIRAVEKKYHTITFHVAGGGEIHTPSDFDPSVILQNLATILASEEFKHLEPGAFSYIDLRYGNKVFVNEGLQLEVATSTEDIE